MVHCSVNRHIFKLNNHSTSSTNSKFELFLPQIEVSIHSHKQQHNVHVRISVVYNNPFLDVLLHTKISQLVTDKVLLIFHSIKVEPVARHRQISSSVYITVIFTLHVEPEANSRTHFIMTQGVWSWQLFSQVILENTPEVSFGS